MKGVIVNKLGAKRTKKANEYLNADTRPSALDPRLFDKEVD